MWARTDDPARARSGQGGKFGAFRDEVRNAWAHPSNNGRRAQTLGRLTLFHLRANVLHQRCSFPLGDHSKIWADRQFPSTGKAVLGNPPDFGYMQAWREFLRPGTLFVDIGANAGIYSVWAADLGASVIAVEPDPDALRALHENEALNRYTFEVVSAALFSASGVMQFTEGQGPWNHVLPDAAAGSGRVAEVTTLDQVLGDRTAHGVKIDVEGAERFVLEGARIAMSEGRLPVIQLEYNHTARDHYGETREPLRDLLVDYGYSFFRPDEHGALKPARKVGGGGRRDVFAIQ
jgi:FkbM family methyltransferase